MTVEPQPPLPHRISAAITGPRGTTLRIHTESDHALDPSPTPWLSAVVPAAMFRGSDVVIDGAVDAEGLSNARHAQSVLSGWYPKHFRRIAVDAEPADTRSPVDTGSRAAGVGCFFSGGVDSFYSAINQYERITHLIFVVGFDIDVDDESLGSRATDAARQAASELGKPLIVVRTTLRSEFGERVGLPWGWIYHGAAMAHVANALSPHVGTVVIPSSLPMDHMHPWGSHPDLDRWWSTSRVAVEHGETDIGRAGKTRRIAASATAMRHLRVCYENRDGAFNCGRCPKCVRTRMSLAIAGAECSTLPGAPRPKSIRNLYSGRGDRIFLRDALQDMHTHDVVMPELERAMQQAIRRSYLLQYRPHLR